MGKCDLLKEILRPIGAATPTARCIRQWRTGMILVGLLMNLIELSSRIITLSIRNMHQPSSLRT